MAGAEQRYFSGGEVTRSLEMKPSADVVVIGGGQVGPAVASALEEFDPTISSVVLEVNPSLAGGASLASAECFRSGWTPQAIAQQVAFSIERILQADDYFGPGAKARLNVRQRGYLYLGRERDIPSMKRAVSLMRSWGIASVEYLDDKGLHDEYPWVPGHFVGARVDRRAGWLDSNSLARLHAEKTKNSRFFMETPAIEIIVSSGAVTGVRTPHGTISTRNVIIASGPGARAMGKSAGIDFPVICVPRQSFTTPFRHDGIPADAPFIIAPSPHAYFRPENTGMLFGWAYERMYHENGVAVSSYLVDPAKPAGSYKDLWFPSVELDMLKRQFGYHDGHGFGDPRYLRGITHNAGFYVYRYESRGDERIRSERAIIDKTDIVGLVACIAHAGHGIMTAPAAGHIAAAHVVGVTPGIPLWEDFRLNMPVVENELGSGL